MNKRRMIISTVIASILLLGVAAPASAVAGPVTVQSAVQSGIPSFKIKYPKAPGCNYVNFSIVKGKVVPDCSHRDMFMKIATTAAMKKGDAQSVRAGAILATARQTSPGYSNTAFDSIIQNGANHNELFCQRQEILNTVALNSKVTDKAFALSKGYTAAFALAGKAKVTHKLATKSLDISIPGIIKQAAANAKSSNADALFAGLLACKKAY